MTTSPHLRCCIPSDYHAQTLFKVSKTKHFIRFLYTNTFEKDDGDGDGDMMVMVMVMGYPGWGTLGYPGVPLTTGNPGFCGDGVPWLGYPGVPWGTPDNGQSWVLW